MENKKKLKAEYLSNDILEENFIRSFAPFHTVQKILGSCRVDIRDRFVSSTTRGQKLITVGVLIITLFQYIYVFVNYLSLSYQFNVYPGIYYISLSSSALYYLTFLCNMIHVKFLNGDSNVKFYVKLQEIDRLMKIDQIDNLNNFLFLNNMITVLIALSLLVVIFFLAIYENYALILGYSGLLYTIICCVLEWLFCADLLVFFFLRLRFINAILKNHLEDESSLTDVNDKFHFPISYICLRRLALKSHNLKTSSTHLYLKAVIEGFSAFENHCRLQILLFFIQSCVQSLISFEFGIIALQKNTLRWMEIVVLPTAVLLGLVLALVLCIRCELFFREVHQTKRLSITILSQNFEESPRRKAKKMLQMIESRPPRLSVYNMWNLNAATLLKMINIMTTLFITLLQFTFL